jgi:tRNA threonylcarbamoyladenosine biosynthesis protein TsaE
MNKNYSLEEISDIADLILKEVSDKVLLFYGEMGVGKTTLIKEIVKQLGVDDVVTSPTFSLVNEYQSRKGETIYHFDFYRIKNEEEAMDIGVDDYFYSNSYCLIEWPEKIKNLVPLNAVEIHLSINENKTRSIKVDKNEKQNQ